MKSLNEVKVLLVGDGGAGKTSLLKRFLGKGFDQAESKTDGINIARDDLKIEKRKLRSRTDNITVNYWDFGGQQTMHATHQFFFSKRSIYILLLDGRKEEDAEYWLKLIQ